MKLALTLAFSFLIVQCFSQRNFVEDYSLIGNNKLNFAIPDLPAFKALDNEPSKILRPSTPESFSALASEFYEGNELIIPKSFGVELSPYLLGNSNRVTLSSYKKNPILYSTRISFGSFRNDQNASTASIGLRITLIDKGDLKNDSVFIQKLNSLLKKSAIIKDSLLDEYLVNNNISEEVFATDSLKMIIANEAVEKQFAEKLSLDEMIEVYKEEYKKDYWNAQKLDFAFAVTGYSNDSLAKNIKYKSTAFWITWALPIKNFGQLLLGSHFYSYKDFENNHFFSDLYLNSRFYLGTNRFKGFAELQYSFQQQDKLRKTLFDVGMEINISDGIWVDFYTGVDKSSNEDRSDFVSSFRIRFALPEDFRD